MFQLFSAQWNLHADDTIAEIRGDSADALNRSKVKPLGTWKPEGETYLRNYSSMDTSTVGKTADVQFWGLSVVYPKVSEGGLVLFRVHEIEVPAISR